MPLALHKRCRVSAGPVATAPASAPAVATPPPIITFPALDLQSPLPDTTMPLAEPPTFSFVPMPAVSDPVPSFSAPTPTSSAPAPSQQGLLETGPEAETALHVVVTLAGQHLVPFDENRQVAAAAQVRGVNFQYPR